MADDAALSFRQSLEKALGELQREGEVDEWEALLKEREIETPQDLFDAFRMGVQVSLGMDARLFRKLLRPFFDLLRPEEIDKIGEVDEIARQKRQGGTGAGGPGAPSKSNAGEDPAAQAPLGKQEKGLGAGGGAGAAAAAAGAEPGGAAMRKDRTSSTSRNAKQQGKSQPRKGEARLEMKGEEGRVEESEEEMDGTDSKKNKTKPSSPNGLSRHSSGQFRINKKLENSGYWVTQQRIKTEEFALARLRHVKDPKNRDWYLKLINEGRFQNGYLRAEDWNMGLEKLFPAAAGDPGKATLKESQFKPQKKTPTRTGYTIKILNLPYSATLEEVKAVLKNGMPDLLEEGKGLRLLYKGTAALDFVQLGRAEEAASAVRCLKLGGRELKCMVNKNSV
uniref:RRM domain-containing protein n=1 Tax=Chromera velia CCMP2878 TaxID=1169474 RepID=A0A0G4H5F2_9ALVE|mmetsp:Transcript_23145/g.45542  ORF Transcript_23145/g.45542 Transcript_23145/m.45542 type:complete len:393 (+) Transcript_23145:196-1374(+)|eukprot:Cvel_24750.t1-p1 / transcript=Cvel_24750.t1 / gene=Cvel_24750 / organism=Chromera_velia_CCMP2878 / gene_product=hypothetical protein / transcript_product=hypothetical protein / location=Cvel_scaffold2719:18808-21857(+) / protein_length=392 / sequence_SO=supercontig / SO=protein_coding / is_pseudo=false